MAKFDLYFFIFLGYLNAGFIGVIFIDKEKLAHYAKRFSFGAGYLLLVIDLALVIEFILWVMR